MRKLITNILTLSLAATMCLPAFADGNQTQLTDADKSATIEVTGNFTAAPEMDTVISADVTWEELTFTYKGGDKTWDAASHSDITGEGGWLPNEQKTITVTNHSNTPIKAGFAFASEVSGLFGNFTDLTNEAFIVDSAEGTAYNNAPNKATAFSVSGSAIRADQKIGTITVTVAKITTISSMEELLATASKAGSFALVNNIDLGTSAFEIASENYVLDLNGFSVSGSGEREGTIRITKDSHVTIKNGTVNNVNSTFGHAVHEKSAKLILKNCTLNSYSSALFSEGGTANAENCNFKTQIADHYNITNYIRCALTLSGTVNFWGGAGLSNQLDATTTVLPGIYNFDVSSYVDTNLYTVTTNEDVPGFWTVTAK